MKNLLYVFSPILSLGIAYHMSDVWNVICKIVDILF